MNVQTSGFHGRGPRSPLPCRTIIIALPEVPSVSCWGPHGPVLSQPVRHRDNMGFRKVGGRSMWLPSAERSLSLSRFQGETHQRPSTGSVSNRNSLSQINSEHQDTLRGYWIKAMTYEGDCCTWEEESHKRLHRLCHSSLWQPLSRRISSEKTELCAQSHSRLVTKPDFGPEPSLVWARPLSNVHMSPWAKKSEHEPSIWSPDLRLPSSENVLVLHIQTY